MMYEFMKCTHLHNLELMSKVPSYVQSSKHYSFIDYDFIKLMICSGMVAWLRPRGG